MPAIFGETSIIACYTSHTHTHTYTCMHTHNYSFNGGLNIGNSSPPVAEINGKLSNGYGTIHCYLHTMVLILHVYPHT